MNQNFSSFDQPVPVPDSVQRASIGGSVSFWATKRVIDILASLVILALVLVIIPFLVVLNPFFNPGRLFFAQHRNGRNLEPFKMWKFRTMSGEYTEARFAPEESHRITPLGRFLRRTHIDELPQAWNVLRGEMSLIGPRPEQRRFVREYLETIPSYRLRYHVRPGITGLAQVEHGYTHTHQGTAGKLKYDLLYIRRSGARMEFCVWYKTVFLLVRKALHHE